MLDWLQEAVAGNEPLAPLAVIAVRTLLAIVAGFCVVAVYRVTMQRRDDNATLPTTLVLLAVLIAVVTMVIGDSVARAFGLVGALSIVRFRTVVEDTRDTAFVIFAVAVGMAVGAGYAVLVVVAVPAVTLAAGVMSWLSMGPVKVRATPAILSVRIGLGHHPTELLDTILAKHFLSFTMTGTQTGRQGSCFEVTYAGPLRNSSAVFDLVAELNRIDGVQSAEVRRG
jgi:hypothetical protein